MDAGQPPLLVLTSGGSINLGGVTARAGSELVAQDGRSGFVECSNAVDEQYTDASPSTSTPKGTVRQRQGLGAHDLAPTQRKEATTARVTMRDVNKVTRTALTPSST